MIVIDPLLAAPVVVAGTHSVKVESPTFDKPIDLSHDQALQASVWLRNLADQLEQAGRGVCRA